VGCKNKQSRWNDSDAIILKGYTIDTALYRVSPIIRAFGIRTNYANQSQPNPYHQETLTLLTNSITSLNVILMDYEVKMFHGETDTNCNGEYLDHNKILIIQRESVEGYFDINIKNTITEETSFLNEQDDCDSTSTARVENTRLQFKGDRYQEVP